jgi:hypothetical protein
MAPPLSPDRMLSQEVPSRNSNQAQERLSPARRPDRILDAIATYLPIRVRRHGVTHHQLKPVAAVREGQSSVVTLQHIVVVGS